MKCDEHYLTTFFKGFFAASVAATATLFAVGFVRQAVHPVGITPANLAAGVLVAFVHLVAIVGFSVIPAAIVAYVTSILQVRFAVVFALCGAGIPWLVLRVIPA
jgi:acetaldehyde dehydrogenase (acetylating)